MHRQDTQLTPELHVGEIELVGGPFGGSRFYATSPGDPLYVSLGDGEASPCLTRASRRCIGSYVAVDVYELPDRWEAVVVMRWRPVTATTTSGRAA